MSYFNAVFMIKSKIKWSNILPLQVAGVFLFTLMLGACDGCGQRVVQDAVDNAKNDFNEEMRDLPPQERYIKALESLMDDEKKDSADQRKGYTEIILNLIRADLVNLSTKPDASDNILLKVLEEMRKLAGNTTTVSVKPHTRISYLLEIFEELQKQQINIQQRTIDYLTNEATKNKEEIMYYPLVMLGGLKSTVGSRSEVTASFGRGGEKSIQILWWTLLKEALNPKLRKAMLKKLIPQLGDELNKVVAVPDDSGNKLTPAMYAVYKHQDTEDLKQSNEIIELVKCFLANENIHIVPEKNNLLDTNVADSSDGVKLNNSALLSFIVYNAVREKTINRDEWIKVIAQALTSGNLKISTSTNDKKQKMKEYIQSYIDNYNDDVSTMSSAVEKVYDQDKLKEVRKMLSDYIGKEVPLVPKKKKKP